MLTKHRKVEQRYKKLQRNIEYLESKTLDANITLVDLKSQLQNANQTLDSCRLSYQKEVGRTFQLHRQNMELGRLLTGFKNTLRFDLLQSRQLKVPYQIRGIY